jgi:phospholipid-translocating ATPase
LDGQVSPSNTHRNLVKNTKYNLITFVPVVLFNQFKFFLNMFFLLTALTQLIPALKVGLIITYLGPLLLVLTLTMAKEAVDDYKRYRRDL